jgi:signal transduction histidine kinase
MESGRVDFNPVALDLADFCREIVYEFRGASGKSHDLIYTPEGNASLVLLDEKLIRQLLTNLLSNAIKYSPKGGEIRVDLVCKADETILCVKDNGIGIPEEDRARLFESFHRAANVGTVSGTGLGLTIAKRAVELHGGEISFESKDGLGTTFTVVIPNAQGEDGDV